MGRMTRAAVALLLVCGLVTGGVVVWFGARGRDAVGQVVARSTGIDVKTIEYDGIRVDVPAQWGRVDLTTCAFHLEHWGPASDDPCDLALGVVFSRSATFDTALQPREVRPVRDGGSRLWAGYVVVGDWAVSTSAPDRAVAERVLSSVCADAG